jgi:hypothetical protein
MSKRAGDPLTDYMNREHISTLTNNKDRRSEERKRLDRFHRQLLHQTEAYGFYVRLYYLEEDDSFFLEWRTQIAGMGSKYYVNPDECFYSLRHCMDEIAQYDETLNPRNRGTLPHNPCSLARRSEPVVPP